jgi:hypothetical protein
MLSSVIPFYDHVLIIWLGRGPATSNAFVPNALRLVSDSISEEIVFRACIFATLAAALDFIAQYFPFGEGY